MRLGCAAKFGKALMVIQNSARLRTWTDFSFGNTFVTIFLERNQDSKETSGIARKNPSGGKKGVLALMRISKSRISLMQQNKVTGRPLRNSQMVAATMFHPSAVRRRGSPAQIISACIFSRLLMVSDMTHVSTTLTAIAGDNDEARMGGSHLEGESGVAIMESGVAITVGRGDSSCPRGTSTAAAISTSGDYFSRARSSLLALLHTSKLRSD
ncbi:hypothetical protein B0H16DRAFT_1476926 [Mycena metata]|uniref:Uncharacterized protein n=1 Tax=Mycena metata TaxID=1033252 RepID=A0AAD7HB82_9AGAR|nr:hypothetical protein B0H16DRAFT_1476926 [Mycena metata]